MIVVVIGTRAQLIKMGPVLHTMEARRLTYRLLMTGQHKETMDRLLEDFSIRTRPEYIYTGPEITGLVQMAFWFLRCLRRLVRDKSHWLDGHEPAASIVIVHGDTFSTLLGAIAARVWRCKVAHVEAGLRSHSIWNPFPEELTRVAVFRLTDIAFSPGTWASDNMRPYRLECIDTGENTLRDALRMILEKPPVTRASELPPTYGVCSIHRFENIFFRRRLVHIVAMLKRAAARCPQVFVLHPATRKKLRQFGLLEQLEQDPRIQLLPRLGYHGFVNLLAGASFVITDGGSNQEELSYMGIPTLLMRRATERQEGLDTTATLCAYRTDTLDDFLDRVEQPRAPYPDDGECSPSSIIVDRLAGFATEGNEPAVV